MKRRALLLAAAVSPLAWAQSITRRWPAGQPTPPLDLPGYDGPRFRLADARGQVVLLNFWGSWCEPCRSEMPALELLEQRFQDQGLRVMAVNFRETDAALRSFLQQTPSTLNILRDTDGATAHAFGVHVFPTSVLIGRDGRAAFSVIGAVDWTGAEAQRWITPLLGPSK